MVPKALSARPATSTPRATIQSRSGQGPTAATDAALSVPGALEQTVKLPFGEMRAADGFGFPFGDLLIHTWDLAHTMGANDRLIPEACTMVLAEVEAVRRAAPSARDLRTTTRTCRRSRYPRPAVGLRRPTGVDRITDQQRQRSWSRARGRPGDQGHAGSWFSSVRSDSFARKRVCRRETGAAGQLFLVLGGVGCVGGRAGCWSAVGDVDVSVQRCGGFDAVVGGGC